MTLYKINREENHLSHYGVDGTHWGIRRYQNKDGSYKPGAEGRYYTPVKRSLREISSVNREKLKEKSSAFRKKWLENKEKSSGGGASTNSERPINKTITGKDIDVKDVSEKKDTSSSDSKTKKSSSSGSKSKSSGSSEGSGNFKVSDLLNKIDNLFDMDNMTDEDWEKMDLDENDIREIDDLITNYRAWRQGNKSNTKKLQRIDEFIDKYGAWKSTHGKHSEPRELYLMHHGILGMHWGIRRYQNKDGTLTEAGKARYRKAFNDYYEKEKKAHNTGKSSDFKSAKKKADEIKNSIYKDTHYTEKTRQILIDAQNKLIAFEMQNPSASQFFNVMANTSIENYQFMMDATKGSYEEFLNKINYVNRSDHNENVQQVKANDPVLQEVYKYGKMQNDINEQLRKDLSALDDLTVSSLGFDPNSEDGKRIKSFIVMNA